MTEIVLYSQANTLNDEEYCLSKKAVDRREEERVFYAWVLTCCITGVMVAVLIFCVISWISWRKFKHEQSLIRERRESNGGTAKEWSSDNAIPVAVSPSLEVLWAEQCSKLDRSYSVSDCPSLYRRATRSRSWPLDKSETCRLSMIPCQHDSCNLVMELTQSSSLNNRSSPS